MFEQIRKIFAPVIGAPEVGREDAITAAIEQTVDGTDPRLRGVSGYRKTLRAAVERSVVYTGKLVERLPSPVEIERSALGRDSLLRAFFSSVDRMRDLFAQSTSFRDFLDYQDNHRLPQCFALLVMEKQEKTLLGHQLQGGIVRAEVKQTAVNFSNHRIITPSVTETETRQKLKERAFNTLVEVALSRLLALRTQRDELIRQKSLLRAKLGRLQASSKFGLEGELEWGGAGDESPGERQRTLEEIEQQLAEMVAHPLTLEHYLKEISRVLERPEDSLELREVPLHLTRMGIKVEPGSTSKGVEFRLHEVAVVEGLSRVVSLVRVPQSEMAAIIRRHSGLVWK